MTDVQAVQVATLFDMSRHVSSRAMVFLLIRQDFCPSLLVTGPALLALVSASMRVAGRPSML